MTLNAGNIGTADNVSLTGTLGSVSETSTGKISGALLTTNSATGTTLGALNTVTSFNATNATSGVVNLANTAGTLTVTGIAQTPGAAVTVTNAGNLTTSGTA